MSAYPASGARAGGVQHRSLRFDCPRSQDESKRVAGQVACVAIRMLGISRSAREVHADGFLWLYVKELLAAFAHVLSASVRGHIPERAFGPE